jgi:hypothetical protein
VDTQLGALCVGLELLWTDAAQMTVASVAPEEGRAETIEIAPAGGRAGALMVVWGTVRGTTISLTWRGCESSFGGHRLLRAPGCFVIMGEKITVSSDGT